MLNIISKHRSYTFKALLIEQNRAEQPCISRQLQTAHFIQKYAEGRFWDISLGLRTLNKD